MRTVDVLADVTPQQLQRYAELAYDKIGITISPQKITLLSNRLRRCLRATGVDSFDTYYERLAKASLGDPEWERFLQEVTTHETYLFRDQKNWDWLCNTFVPELVRNATSRKRRKSIRVWSAACSTGDEAYTIAACLADRLPSLADWEVSIFGTDVGADAVAHASNPRFGERAMRLVPESYRRRFFDKASDNAWIPKPVLQNMTRFEVHNLLMPLKQAPFDLIVLGERADLFRRGIEKEGYRAGPPPNAPRFGARYRAQAEGISEMVKELESIQGWLHCIPRHAGSVAKEYTDEPGSTRTHGRTNARLNGGLPRRVVGFAHPVERTPAPT